MIPPRIRRDLARREQEARALLESHPDFPKAKVQIYERWKANKIPERLAATKRGSDERMEILLESLNACGEAYVRLVSNMQLHKAFSVTLRAQAKHAWADLTGQPFDPLLIALFGKIGNDRWKTLVDCVLRWENEGMRGLIPVGNKNETRRRGYRDHIRAWMRKMEIGTVKDAARRLGVSESTLKSVMSAKGKVRYGDQTLADILKKTGYESNRNGE